MAETTYTAISFAPVQGFIEKSRKLRDLYGASGLLSYLAQRLIEATPQGCIIISPVTNNFSESIPNRLLVKGEYPRNLAEQTLLQAWQQVLIRCRTWIETLLQDTFAINSYQWQEIWAKWERYHWEIFWGHGNSIELAMRDLETRKLRRDWVAVNWTGESSSLSGTDAIAWPGLGAFNSNPGLPISELEKAQLNRFYEVLAEHLSSPGAAENDTTGRFLAANERLSVPELVKRLVTWPSLAKQIGITELEAGFTDIHRNTRDDQGQWTGWFMGDGDHIGDHLQTLAKIGDKKVTAFSEAMREWGRAFKEGLAQDQGRIIYAGGDDFLGVLYGQRNCPLASKQALSWLMELNAQWQQHKQPVELSTGFVWVSPNVPQRDVLQHCRYAQKRAKQLGRNRVTIRVVFDSGQFVEWTCRWQDLNVLRGYRDRKGVGWDNNPNWAHIFTDWAQLKARHAVPTRNNPTVGDETVAIAFFDLYFPGYGETLLAEGINILGPQDDHLAMIDWINGAINIGWHLASD